MVDMPRTRLVYGEDLASGMWVEYERPARRDAMSSFLVPAQRDTAYVLVHEVRRYGPIISAIVIDEDGEQQSLGLPEYGLTRILVDTPLGADLTVAQFEERT